MIPILRAHSFAGTAIVLAAFQVGSTEAQTSTWEDKANGQGPFLCCTNGVNCIQFFWPDNDLWTQSEVVSCTPPVVRYPSNWTTPANPNGTTDNAIVDALPPVLLTSDITLGSLTIGTQGVVNLEGGSFTLVNAITNQGHLRCGFPSGAGTINAGTSILNNATIEGGTGYISFASDGWNLSAPDITNNGVIRGTDDGYLLISNAVIANNGIIEALDDSQVKFGTTLVIGGEFRSGTGTSEIQVLSDCALAGFIVNDGLVRVDTSPLSQATIYGETEFTGNGQLLIAGGTLAGDPATDPAVIPDEVRNNGNHVIRCGEAGGASGTINPGIRFTNDAVIEGGSGAINFASDGWDLAAPDIVNNGVILAVDGGFLQISNAIIVNNGVLAALDDSQLNLGNSLVIGGEFLSGTGSSEIQVLSGTALSGFIVNNAFVEVDTNPLSLATVYGETELSGGGRLLLTDSIAGDSNTDPASIVDRLTNGAGHTILGNRTIGPGLEFINKGVIEPGTSVGTLTVSGPFVQTQSGVLSVEIASLTSRDRLVVNGPATLDGAISISFLSGFLPALGNQFQVLTASSIAGSFSSVIAPPGWQFQANVGATSVTLQVIAVCGDSTCGPGETQCNCPSDCGAPPSTETNCSNGQDDDCDGETDCADVDCAGNATDCPNGQIPAVSDWGMLIMTLLTLIAATMTLSHRRQDQGPKRSGAGQNPADRCWRSSRNIRRCTRLGVDFFLFGSAA